MKKLLCLLGLIVFAARLYANVPMPWTDTADVSGMNQAVVGIIEGDSLKIPILFPQSIPSLSPGMQYYASYQIYPKGYELYIDSNSSCHGDSRCNLLTLVVNNFTVGDLKAYQNIWRQTITTSVLLNDGSQANYTEGFTDGEYYKPRISWYQNNASYTLIWVGMSDPDQTQKNMIWMVNNLQMFAPPPPANL